MTKWARMKRRQERKRKDNAAKTSALEENKEKLSEQENTSSNVSNSHATQKEIDMPKTPNSGTILSQIPRYIYLVAIFALLSGFFFPLITTGADSAFSFVIGGTAILFLGLSGGILIFKATSNKRQGISLAVGLALIAVSVALIFLLQDLWRIEYF